MSDKNETQRVCFVVGPIGGADTDTRTHADWLLEEIIQPVMAKVPNFKVVRADSIADPGMIDAQIIRHLLDSDLVIADLSTLNANAFYEIGIRHMAQKPIVHMQRSEDDIPFDVSLYRAVKFSRVRPSDIRQARELLRLAVEAVLAKDYQVDNPITRTRGQISIEQHATPEIRSLMAQVKDLRIAVEQLQGTTIPHYVSNTPKSDWSIWYVTFEKGFSSTRISGAVLNTLGTYINRMLQDIQIGKDFVRFVVDPKFTKTVEWQNLLNNLMAIPGVEDVNDIPF